MKILNNKKVRTGLTLTTLVLFATTGVFLAQRSATDDASGFQPRPAATEEAERLTMIPDRMETYRAIDGVCSEEQNRSKCLADLLVETERDLEQTLGAKLKDTWPAARDASCPSADQDTLNRCRIYETLKFEAQVLLFRQG